MATQESWLQQDIILVEWTHPLNRDELAGCFARLNSMLKEKRETIHILFEITNSGSVPAHAPMLALKSGFLSGPNLGKVAVVGMAIVPQILAQVAASVSGKDITFFPLMNSALAFLKDSQRQAEK